MVYSYNWIRYQQMKMKILMYVALLFSSGIYKKTEPETKTDLRTCFQVYYSSANSW